jgi:hypothetical protein
MVKGKSQGTVTDVNGNFRLENVSQGDVLVFSFVGMKNQEVTLGNQVQLNVVLESQLTDLEEVVVVGFGVQKKKLVTGATVQVSSEDIQSRNSTNVLQALQGQTAEFKLLQLQVNRERIKSYCQRIGYDR